MLSRIERSILNEVFAKHAKYDFSKGIYETDKPVMMTSGTAATSTAIRMPTNYSYTQNVRTVRVPCVAHVAGLDLEKFEVALEEYLALHKERMYNILKGEVV
jgi:hypothetical protein